MDNKKVIKRLLKDAENVVRSHYDAIKHHKFLEYGGLDIKSSYDDLFHENDEIGRENLWLGVFVAQGTTLRPENPYIRNSEFPHIRLLTSFYNSDVGVVEVYRNLYKFQKKVVIEYEIRTTYPLTSLND